MTIAEAGVVVGIAFTVSSVGVGVFRYMLKSHEDVCTVRWDSHQAAQHATDQKNDERHTDNQKNIYEVKQSQIYTERQLATILTTLAVLAERTKVDRTKVE